MISRNWASTEETLFTTIPSYDNTSMAVLCNCSARKRTIALSVELWLRNGSYPKSPSVLPQSPIHQYTTIGSRRNQISEAVRLESRLKQAGCAPEITLYVSFLNYFFSHCSLQSSRVHAHQRNEASSSTVSKTMAPPVPCPLLEIVSIIAADGLARRSRKNQSSGSTGGQKARHSPTRPSRPWLNGLKKTGFLPPQE